MATTVTEKMLSRKIVAGVSSDILYTIRGTDSYDTALADLITAHATNGSPGLNLGVSGLSVSNIRVEYSVEPVYIDTTNASVCIWDGTVRYYLASTSRKDTGSGETPSSWSFSTGGATQKITQSFSTIVTPGDAPETNGAIDFDGKTIKGCDIIVPDFRFSITVTRTAAQFPLTTAAAMAYMSGTVNNATFQGFAAGEVLYLNTDGQQDQKTGNWILKHNFAVKKNRPAGTVIGGLTTTSIRPGWYYDWIKYEEDTADPLLLKKPVALYSEQVYPDGDLTTLPGLS